MSNDFYTNTYNPDVLSCLANLSNDEVFTPPEIVNQMLDMLPKELWHDKNATFLEPTCKTGVFLREIAKRLLDGLNDEIPELHMPGGKQDQQPDGGKTGCQVADHHHQFAVIAINH